jgi:mannonate dehydratase
MQFSLSPMLKINWTRDAPLDNLRAVRRSRDSGGPAASAEKNIRGRRSMDRRKFFSVTGAGAAAAAAGSIAAGTPVAEAQPAMPGGACASAKLPPLKARLGHQFGTLTDDTAAWVARYGVDAICTSPKQTDPSRLYPTADEMNAMLDLAHKWKLKVELVDSILLRSSLIDRE